MANAVAANMVPGETIRAEWTRETFGNIPHSSQIIFYLLILVSVAIFGFGFWRRWKLWTQGSGIGFRQLLAGAFPEVWRRIKPGIRRVLVEAAGQKRVFGRRLATPAHLLLFYGFVVLLIGTTLLEIDNIVSHISARMHFHRGLYYVVYEMALDAFGVFFLIGCALFAWRRMRRPPSVGHEWSDWGVLALFAGLGLSGFLLEGLRIGWQKPPNDWGLWCSPVGWWVSHFFDGWDESSIRSAHLGVWWAHAAMVMVFFASVPFTRLRHFVAGPLNLFGSPATLGVLQPVSMEKVEETGEMGINRINQFTQQQLLSMDACMECGRCEEACPAYATRKPLSPKAVVQDLRTLLNGLGLPKQADLPELHGGVIKAETLWSCTACSACVRVCPVRVDPLSMILEMRRNRVAEGTLSGTPATAMRRMQSSANPWGLPAADRPNWAEGLEVPLAKDAKEFEVLYWVGCAGSYDRRAQKVARAVVKLLKAANVSFAILGREEKCTGESARRLGDEFLFQELAQANIATLGKYKFQRILAHCPHCLNSLLKDYSQMGGNYTVTHHSEFIAGLLRDGRLKAPDRSAGIGSVTYHDPCYLARVNDIHQAPRDVLMAALQGEAEKSFREMPRCRTKTFCCGAGGGRMWMEEPPQQRVSTLRAAEALATGAKTVAVGCPFCLTMISDGVAAQNAEGARVLDISEILAENLGL